VRRLIIRSLAEAEIEQAHLWYADRSPDAARNFLDEIGAWLASYMLDVILNGGRRGRQA